MWAASGAGAAMPPGRLRLPMGWAPYTVRARQPQGLTQICHYDPDNDPYTMGE
jgi:hypothetical protein